MLDSRAPLWREHEWLFPLAKRCFYPPGGFPPTWHFVKYLIVFRIND